MRIAKYMAAAAAAALAVSPAMAAPANPAASLSVSKSVRATSAQGKQLDSTVDVEAVLAYYEGL